MQKYGCEKFKEELSNLLGHVCRKCGRMGPGVGESDFKLIGGWTWQGNNGAEESWFCSNCTEESPEYAETIAKLRENTERLSRSTSSGSKSFKLVKSTSSDRIIVAPACLTENTTEVSNALPSCSTRILVPQDATAIRTIMECCDEAVEDRVEQGCLFVQKT